MNYPLISVLIPTFNVERFVEEAIRSIINQTYSNLEIIIVDDCSSDNTYEILQRLAVEDSRIRLFKNQENKKIVETLNLAISYASGEFIARMDGDDVSLPDKIEKQYRFLMANPNIDLVGVSYIIIDEDGKEIKKEKYLTDFDQIKKAVKYVSPIPHIWLARKRMYELLGGYRLPTVEDYDFILRAIDQGYQLSNLPDFLYLVRMRRGNTATSAGLVQKKSFNYAKKLHKERISCQQKEDSYSTDNLKNFLKSSAFEEATFRLAAQFNHKFVLNKNARKYSSMIWLLLAILFSPKYVLQEKFNRFSYRRILKGI